MLQKHPTKNIKEKEIDVNGNTLNHKRSKSVPATLINSKLDKSRRSLSVNSVWFFKTEWKEWKLYKVTSFYLHSIEFLQDKLIDILHMNFSIMIQGTKDNRLFHGKKNKLAKWGRFRHCAASNFSLFCDAYFRNKPLSLSTNKDIGYLVCISIGPCYQRPHLGT